MAIHVEIPGDFGQGQLDAVKFWSENDLASQPGVLLKHGRHVQHIILPKESKIYKNQLSPFHPIKHTRFCKIKCMSINVDIRRRHTSLQDLAVCQNEHHSHRPDKLSRQAMPHRLLNETNTHIISNNCPKIILQLNHFKCVNTHLQVQFHACVPGKEHCLPLWP